MGTATQLSAPQQHELCSVPSLGTWSHVELVGLARRDCTVCGGAGVKHRSKLSGGFFDYGEWRPCNCVLREAFRQCWECFREIQTSLRCGLQTYSSLHSRFAPWQVSRSREEYSADFVILARRLLPPREYQIFRWHYLLGADWAYCARRLGMARGNMFHAFYRIQQTLGRAYHEIRPYPLHPLSNYFTHPRRQRAC